MAHKLWFVCSVLVSKLTLSVLANQEEGSLSIFVEQDGQVQISPALKDDPASFYQLLKNYSQERRTSEFKVGGLGSLTIGQLLRSCGSIEGNCDVTDLGILDEEVHYKSEEVNLDWTKYTNYCREQWVSKCDAADTMLRKIKDSFSREEWLDARELVDLVLREPFEKRDPGALNVNYRYPNAVVKFLRAKDADLEKILHLRKGKRDQFKQRYIQFVRPVCEKVVSSLEHAVSGMKWANNDVISMENPNPTVESGLKIFRICLKISLEEDKLMDLSYDLFSGKDKTLMNKLRKKTLSGLGVKD